MTPTPLLGPCGSLNSAPTTTSEPRGSFTTAERNQSYFDRNRCNLSASVPGPKSGAPEITSRVGSPPVWESMIRTLCVFCCVIPDATKRDLRSFIGLQHLFHVCIAALTG